MVYIVTAVHNRYKITKKFVELLTKQTYKDFTLVLVDDGCTDGTAEMVLSYLPKSIILKGNGNLFWGGALHLAYKWLKSNAVDGSFIWIANDDTEFDDDYLQKALAHFTQKDSDFLLSGCGYATNVGKYYDLVHMCNLKTGISEKNDCLDFKGNIATTRSLFFTIETMKKIGGFHPVLLPHYGSDYEWTLRAYKKGIETRSYSDVHYNYVTAEGEKKNYKKNLKTFL